MYALELESVGLSLMCFPRDTTGIDGTPGGYPQVMGVKEGGPCWHCGRVFAGDSVERVAGVDLLDSTPQTVAAAFASCKAGRQVLLKLKSRAGEAKSVTVISKQTDGAGRTYGTGLDTTTLRPQRATDIASRPDLHTSIDNAHRKSSRTGEAMPVIATLQRLSNKSRFRPLVYSIATWKMRIAERHYYKDLCARILGAMKHRSAVFAFHEWRDLARSNTARRALFREIELQITSTRILIEKTESLQAWKLETAASRPWGCTCRGRRSAEELTYIATTIGIRDAEAQVTAETAAEAERAQEAAKPKVLMISVLEARNLLAKDINGYSDPYMVRLRRQVSAALCGLSSHLQLLSPELVLLFCARKMHALCGPELRVLQAHAMLRAQRG